MGNYKKRVNVWVTQGLNLGIPITGLMNTTHITHFDETNLSYNYPVRWVQFSFVPLQRNTYLLKVNISNKGNLHLLCLLK